jgi:uracil-DNA glycosylase
LRNNLSAPVASPNRNAREAASRARTLEDLEAALRLFEGCALKATAKNLCFYRGNPQGRLMVIGEAPGREEDLEGRPFVGPAGQLLDRMLAAIDLTEADVHITNVVYWRPPGNRPPTLDEVEACRPFLARQIELVAPRFVMTLGSPAAKAILGATDGILRVRGKWGEITAGELKVPVMPTLHPAYLLRTPAAKRQAWRDLLAVKLALAEGEPE